MEKTILKYQKVFNDVINKLKSNQSVLAVMVFGSMVTGDLWEKSDIDLFVICKSNNYDLRNIYTEENNVSVHIKLVSEESFLEFNKKNLKGGFIHRIISSSRLVFSKSMDITSKYDVGRYYYDIDRERWNMAYLGNMLKNESLCKKYLHNEEFITAYVAAIKSVEEFSKLYVNSVGYMISNNAVSVAMNLNGKLKEKVDLLLFDNRDEAAMKASIISILDYMDEYINKNIREFVNVLVNYMKERDCLLSSEDIKSDELFMDYNINMEEILDKLWERNIIKKQKKNYIMNDETVLLKENVYFI